ncbi:putative ATP synthase subunit 4, mitochondrial (putative) [Pseudozyma hubeiensis]|nr:putative ATP synthase subunit 4, mitochondrial (putative) [Pseudozyma hubeiensis]
MSASVAAPVRLYSDKPSPEARASSIIDSLPGNSLVSKTGWSRSGRLTAVAISKRIAHANETVIRHRPSRCPLPAVLSSPARSGLTSDLRKSPRSSTALAPSTEAVQSRITSVESQKDVVGLTQALYRQAKETAQSRREVERQKTALAGEVKSVLDSWVRFEASEREQEQRELEAPL